MCECDCVCVLVLVLCALHLLTPLTRSAHRFVRLLYDFVLLQGNSTVMKYLFSSKEYIQHYPVHLILSLPMSPFSHPVLRCIMIPSLPRRPKKNAPCTKNTSIHATSKSNSHIKTRPVKREREKQTPSCKAEPTGRDETSSRPSPLLPQSSPFCAGPNVVARVDPDAKKDKREKWPR
ncbi:hypothetical protein V8C43DRAFT_269656 [Trichoderma afarasin]